MYYISKTMEIAGCHQLRLSYESKCNNLHGHNWRVTIHCKSKELNEDEMYPEEDISYGGEGDDFGYEEDYDFFGVRTDYGYVFNLMRHARCGCM